MPDYARFKQNPPINAPVNDINLTGITAMVSDTVGAVSKPRYLKNFSDNIPRDCLDVVFGEEEFVGIPTECLDTVTADSAEDAAALFPAWE